MTDDRALEELLAEGQELVESLHRELLFLDEELAAGRLDLERLGGLVRAVHTLKGLAGALASDALVAVSHRLEDLLGVLRESRLPVSPPVVDLLFEAAEQYKQFFAPTSEEHGALELAERIARVAASASPVEDRASPRELDPAVTAVLLVAERDRVEALQRAGQGVWRVSTTFPLATVEGQLEELRARLRDVGEVVTCMPASRPTPAGHIALDLLVATRAAAALEALAAKLGVELRLLLVPHTLAAESGVPIAVPFEDTTRAVGGGTVRVDARRLDEALTTLAGLRADLHGSPDAVKARLAALERSLLEMRMVPLAQLFDKLARVVRSLARDARKDIVLEIRGAETPLDKVLVEELSEPLMHILRNAVDHGIEDAGPRVAAGKPAAGKLVINAHQKKDRVVIDVIDDGRGLDEALIRETALRRGLVAADAVERLSRADVLNLVFLPGFSTREQANQLSGRGVGLEVVHGHVARMSGLIDLASTPGAGTRFTLSLPSSLALARALLVSVADRVYAVPHATVLDAQLLVAVETRVAGGRELADLTGREIPLLHLDRHLRLERGAPPAREWVVVVGLAEQRLGLVVDDLAGVEDVVVSGAGTAARRGSEVVLVVDVARLLQGLSLSEAA
jgi:two-component system, chemotaxis family, sensor kinase CheA